MSMRRMVRNGVAALALLPVLSVAALAGDPVLFPSTLAGHAAVPAMTLIQPPPDAGPLFATSGKFAGPDRKRVETLGTIPTLSYVSDAKAPRGSGVGLPLAGQAVQGFSAILPLGGGEFLTLTDNGFGSKASSPDVLLMVHKVKADWATGKAAWVSTLFLHDPDKKIPFLIVNENSEKRYLTGSDIDPESMVLVGDRLFIGDEFGPYLLEVDKTGKVVAFHETVLNGKPLRSPDHYRMSLPNLPAVAPFEVRRSRGFEALTASPDGKTLYVALENALWNADTKGLETGPDGKAFVRILEFDVTKGAYTGKSWKYALEDKDYALADMSMVDDGTAVVIERDDSSEGDIDQACKGEVKADCFNIPAKFKRVYKIDIKGADADGYVRKVGYVDLLAIRDPDRKARIGGSGDRFSMPHLGAEGLTVVDADHIAVVNDNNLPYSSGRAIGKADDNEIALLKVTELLRAK